MTLLVKHVGENLPDSLSSTGIALFLARPRGSWRLLIVGTSLSEWLSEVSLSYSGRK